MTAKVFWAALLVRLAVLPHTLPRYDWGRAYPDTEQYLAMASNLRHGEGLVVSPAARAVRPPLYPILLAALQALFGEGRAFALAVILAQCAAGAGAAALAAALARDALGERPAWIAGLLAALQPELVFWPSLILTEALSALLVAAALLAAWRDRPVAAGLLAGAAALTRASLLPLGVLLAAWMVLRSRRLRGGLLCVGAAAAAVLPWTLRNRAVLGAWVPVTTSMGWDLYAQCAPESDGGPACGKVPWPREALALDEVSADRFLRRRSIERIREDPGRFARLSGVRFLRFWNPGPNDAEHRTPWRLALSWGFNLPLFALAAAGALRPFPARALALLPVALLCGLHLVFTGSIRYRAPLLPCVAVLAAAPFARRA